MSNGLMISAWALSAQGSEINQDNVYLNGHYFTPDNNEEVISYSKASNVEFQMYGVCDGDAQGDPESAPAYAVMQRMQHLQSVLSMDGTVTRDKIWSFLCDTNARIRDMQTAAGTADISSTFACLFLQKNRGLAVHLGDSRIYVIRGGRMLQITEDHLEANDLYKLGVITQQQAEVHKLKSKPTAKLGMQDIYEVEASVFSKYFVFYPGDIFLICTDGITDSISNAAIERTIAGIQDPSEIAETLLRMTFNKNQDNKSIVVLHVDEVDGEMAPVREVAVEETPEEAYEEVQEEAYDETQEEEPAEEAAYDYEEEGEAAYEESEEAYADSAEEPAEEYDEDEEEDDEDEEEEKPAKKSLDLRSKLASLAAKVGVNKKDPKPEEEEESDEDTEDEETEEEEKTESPMKKLGGFFSRFTQKSSDEEEDEKSEEEESEEDSDETEMPESDENKVEDAAEDDTDVMDEETDEEEEDEDEDEKKSPILGALAFLKGKFAKGKENDADAEKPEAEDDEAEDEDEENEDEELSILDKIFADPKRILAILGGIVILIILIVLLSTKGCKSGNGDTSSVEESSLVEESSKEESGVVEESSEEESSIEEESSVEESSEESSKPEISGYTKTEDEGKKDRPADLPEESSEEESYEESYEESSYYEESSVYYPPEESSVYYPPVESSYEDPVKYITIQEGGYVTYWDIIIDFYGEWSDELYSAFCAYNGIDVDSPLSYGQVLSIPPISYLDL